MDGERCRFRSSPKRCDLYSGGGRKIKWTSCRIKAFRVGYESAPMIFASAVSWRFRVAGPENLSKPDIRAAIAGAQAAIRAGYSAKTAQQQAWRLLSNVKVAAIAAAQAERSKRTAVTADMVVAEWR